jgi:outer membrane protein OmpA-like peptidoglycan-associated protein
LAQGKAAAMMRRRMSRERDKTGLRGCAVALALTAAAGLAACSSTPKYVNPVELYRGAAGFSLNDDTTGERNAQNLEAGRNQPYPNLGTVPPPPDRAMSGIDRQKLQQGLTDDRAQAKQTDADLRASAAAATGAPRSITRPAPISDDAAPADAAPAAAKRGTDGSLLSGRSDANGVQRRSRPGSEPAPQETALNSPATHAMPQGDTPRPAPPPPSLPPPEKARKPATNQAAKSPLAPAKRPPPAPQTAAADPQRSPASSADAGSPRSSSPAGTATAGTASTGAPTATVPSAVPADQATHIPPPPPADMMMPAPDTLAAAEPLRSAPPPPAVAPPADTAKPAAAPMAKADTTVPAAAWPPPLGPSDTQNSPPEQTAALDLARPPQPSQAAAPAPTAKPPEQQAALAPPPLGPSDPQNSPPERTAALDLAPPPQPSQAAAPAPTAKAPEQQSALAPPPLGPSDRPNSPPEQTPALDLARPPQPSQAAAPAPTAKPPEQQAALAPPPQAMPRAQEAEPAAVTPPPPRTGRLGSVSMQAAEIRFASNGLTLTPDDDRRLADVVKLYDKHGGLVRIVGYGRRGYGADAAQQELASFSKAIERANVVAKALTQLGLASNRIVVQAAPIGDGLGEDRAEVLLEF